MVNSAVANVGRWSALAFGLFYGYTHNISLQKQAEQKRLESEYQRKERLIQQAKLEYAKKHNVTTTTSPVTIDIESPDFDLEKYIEQYEKSNNQS